MLRRAITLVCALVLGTAAVLGFASGPLRHAIRGGAPGTYWVLGAGVVALVASVVLAWRQRPSHAAFGVACLALPQIAALASSVWTGRKLDRALDGLVGDVVPRIVAEGTSELLLPVSLADLFTAACAATMATGLLARPLESRPPAKRVVIVGGAWTIASIVLFVVSIGGHELGLRPLVPILVAAMVAIAIASRGDRDVPILVAFASVLAVCLLDRAIIERAHASAFGDLSREATPALEQARLLAGYLRVRDHGRVALLVHFVLGIATFLAAYGLPRKSRAPVLTVMVLVGAIALRERRAFDRRMEHARTAFDVGVPLPSTNVKSGWWVDGDRFVVTRNGALTEIVPRSEIEDEEPVTEGSHYGPPPRAAKAVLADADLECGPLVAALEPKRKRRQSFSLATVYSAPNVPRPSVGDLEPLVGDRELVGLGFDLEHHFVLVESTLVNDTLEVKLPGQPPLLFALSIDLDEAARAVAARRPEPLSKRDTVQLTVHANDTVRRLAAALGILTVAFPMASTWEHRYFALRVE